MNLIKSQSNWNKSFSSFSSNTDKLRTQAHTLACSALGQCGEKNMNWMQDMLDLCKGKRVFSQSKLIEWVHTYSPIRYNFKEQKFQYSAKAENQEYDLDTAMENPFFDTEDKIPSKKLRTQSQAAKQFAVAMARRILADDNEDSVDDFDNYPSIIRDEITNAMLKESTIKWVREYELQDAS